MKPDTDKEARRGKQGRKGPGVEQVGFFVSILCVGKPLCNLHKGALRASYCHNKQDELRANMEALWSSRSTKAKTCSWGKPLEKSGSEGGICIEAVGRRGGNCVVG